MANHFIAHIQATNSKCFVVAKNQAKVFFADPEADIVNPTLYNGDKIERINDVYLNKSTDTVAVETTPNEVELRQNCRVVSMMVDNNTPSLMVIE